MYLSCELVSQHSYETVEIQGGPSMAGAGGPRVPDVKNNMLWVNAQTGDCQEVLWRSVTAFPSDLEQISVYKTRIDTGTW